jgi:hypothetical protein
MKMHVLLGLLILGVLLAGCAAPPTDQQTYYGPGGNITTTGAGDLVAKLKACVPGTAFTQDITSPGGKMSTNYNIIEKQSDGTCYVQYEVSGQSSDGESGGYTIDQYYMDGKLVRTGQTTSQ